MTDIPICEQCGQQHVVLKGYGVGKPSCAGHRRYESVGKTRVPLEKPYPPCGAYPKNGQAVCRAHGGATRQAEAAGEKRIAEQQAERLALKWGLPVETTPTDAILEHVRVAAGLVRFYGDRVRELADQDMVWGMTKQKIGGDDGGTTYEAKPHIWLVMHDQERDRLVKFCGEAIRANIDERRVRLAEQEGALVAQVIKAILADLGLTKAQQAKVATVVPRHLNLLRRTDTG